MKISRRITLSFLVFGIIIYAISLIGVKVIKPRLEEMGNFNDRYLYPIQTMESKLVGAVEESFAYVVSGETGEKEEFLEWAEEFPEASKPVYEILKSEAGSGKEKIIFSRIISKQKLLVKTAGEMFAEYERGGEVSSEIFHEYENYIDDLTTDFALLVKVEKTAMKESHALTLATINNSLNWIYGIGILALIFSLGMGSFISRSIVNSIKKLQHTINKISEGNYSNRVKNTSRDELGALGESFNKMAEKLETRTNEIILAKSDLEVLVQERTKEIVFAKELAEKANRAKSEFLSSMSHELRIADNIRHLKFFK